MANEKKLDCVILGLLCHEDLTGYEIKNRIDTGLSLFWSASFGSIYPTLKELVRTGMAVSDTKKQERKKITYSITKQGRQYLKNWLQKPVAKDELHYETLLKLFFADAADTKTAIKHIENFETKIKYSLSLLKMAIKNLETNIEGDTGDGSRTHLYYLLTAKFGAEVYETYLKWCEETKKTLKEAD